MSVCDRSELMVILKVITAEDLDQAVRLEGVGGGWLELCGFL